MAMATATESSLTESFIGVTTPKDSSEMAIQRWREACALIKNPRRRFRFVADLSKRAEKQAMLRTNQEKLRVAVLASQAAFQFIKGMNSENMKETERMEEAIATKYYCYKCCHVVTVDVEMKCPDCQGGFIQACEGVTSLYLAMSSESEHSGSDSDGQGTIVIPSLDETVLVQGSYGSNLSRPPLLSPGSHDDNIDYYESHQQIMGHDDSNLNESFLLGIASHVDTNHNEAGHVARVVGPYDSNPNRFIALRIDENMNFDHPGRGTRVVAATFSEWVFILTGLVLEILSAGFDQVSTPSKSHYALISLLLAIGAVLICTCELIHNAIKEIRSVASHDHEINNMFFGTLLPDMFGLGLAIVQLICSAVQYYFLHKHANNPMKLSIVPLFFFCCLVVLKLKSN